MIHTLRYWIKYYSFYLGGDQLFVPWVERIRAIIGAFIGLMLVLTIAKYLGELNGMDEWLMASLGASALLVFALPQSPMAQPWAVIAGNTLSALVGIGINHFVDQPLLAMPAAAMLSILGMYGAALFASSCSGGGLNCCFGENPGLPLCFFPSHGRFGLVDTGRGGLQQFDWHT